MGLLTVDGEYPLSGSAGARWEIVSRKVGMNLWNRGCVEVQGVLCGLRRCVHLWTPLMNSRFDGGFEVKNLSCQSVVDTAVKEFGG